LQFYVKKSLRDPNVVGGWAMGNYAAKKRLRITVLVLMLVFCIFAGGCTKSSSAGPSEYVQTPSASLEATPPAGGAKADVISYIYTTKRSFAITFSGMADKKTMETLLDELDKYNMKALFFLPGMRVAEEPDIANEILRRGHSIGNVSLSGVI
jgi:peptidoglycan/xylan/chitin deacetylase (PgdA/CDA1 family)